MIFQFHKHKIFKEIRNEEFASETPDLPAGKNA